MKKKLLMTILSLTLACTTMTGCYTQTGTYVTKQSVSETVDGIKVSNESDLTDAFIGLGVSSTIGYQYKLDFNGSGFATVKADDGTKYTVIIEKYLATEIQDENGNKLADVNGMSDSTDADLYDEDSENLYDEEDFDSENDFDDEYDFEDGEYDFDDDYDYDDDEYDFGDDDYNYDDDEYDFGDDDYNYDDDYNNDIDLNCFDMDGVSYVIPMEYKYDRGDKNYRIFIKNGSEYELPAYTYSTTGHTNEEMVDKLCKDCGGKIVENVTEGNYKWDYASIEFANEYNEYTYSIVAFNKDKDIAVWLMVRPQSGKFSQDLKDDLVEMLTYMFCF